MELLVFGHFQPKNWQFHVARLTVLFCKDLLQGKIPTSAKIYSEDKR